MPVDQKIVELMTLDERDAVMLFCSHTGLRDMLRQLMQRFSAQQYLKNYDAEAAQTYLQGQWRSIVAHFAALPPTFKTGQPAVETLVRIGWAERFSAERNGFYRWKPAAFQRVFTAATLEELLGEAGYVRLWGIIFLHYLKTVFLDLKLEATVSNEKAEELIVQEPRFWAKGYGEMFGKLRQRVWTEQQAMAWAASEIPETLADLKDSERLVASYLVRVYCGVFTNATVRSKYGNWRSGMTAISRMGLLSEQ